MKTTSLVSRNNSTTTKNIKDSDPIVSKVSEKTVYQGYRTVLRREVILPNQRNVSFDVVYQKSPSIVVFIWHKDSSTSTLIREYHPGVEKFMYGAVAGMYEEHKHSSPLEAAKFELEEEAHLKANTWIPLLADDATSTPLDKYSNNLFYPFLAMDCEIVDNPKPLDDEEFIMIEHNVTHSSLMNLISHGGINLVSTYTILLGLRKLKELGIPVDRSKS